MRSDRSARLAVRLRTLQSAFAVSPHDKRGRLVCLGRGTKRATAAEQRVWTRQRGLFFADDGGFTSVGVAVAILLVAALLFTSVQVYWINSNAADIQVAADAGALAATNVVGEYMVVARVVDAVVLSLSLTGLVLFAVGAVAACIPYVSSIAKPLLEIAQKVIKARDGFASRAIEALDKLQDALPFLCAVNAVAVIQANGAASALQASYVGLTIPVPLQGEKTEIPADEPVKEAGKTIEENNPEVTEASIKADAASKEMNEAKLAGFMADCGNAGASMQERASTLAGMSGTSNPDYASVDTWGFEAALQRARAYYRTRIEQEGPENDQLEELVRSIARKRFYEYASAELESGRVSTDASGTTTAYLPLLPENTDDIRQTELYTERVYPISSDGVIHATISCPACDAWARSGSVCDIESGAAAKCETCNFSATTLGRAPAASTSIDNGFEHHYRDCAKAAEHYSEAARKYADATSEAKEKTTESFDDFSKALESLKAKRYDPNPPGRYGCVAIVIDASEHAVPASLGHFVQSDTSIGPRVAISAATLAPDDPSEGANIISSLLSNLVEQESGASGGTVIEGAVLLWGDLLLAYLNGTEGLIGGVGSFLEGFPVIGSHELSSWAEKGMTNILELVGFQPVQMESLKPVLVNTTHVLSKDSTGAGEALAAVRKGYTSIPGNKFSSISGSLFSGLAAQLRSKANAALDTRYTIASIEVVEGFPVYEVKVSLPDSVKGKASGYLDNAASSPLAWGSSSEGGDALWN